MSYERNWAFSFDNGYLAVDSADASRYQSWGMKALLLGQLGGLVSGLWTCYYSCDSVTAGAANDGVDRWGTSFDASKLVYGTAAAARSWFVLKSPSMNGTTFYATIDLGNATATSVNLFFSKAAPTGGSTTARPTATDEWTWGNLADTLWAITALTAPYVRLNMCLSSTGDFIFFASNAGNSFRHIATMAIAPVACNAGDNYPIFTFKYFTATFTPVFSSAFYQNVQHTNQTGGAVGDRVGLCSLPMGGNDATNPFTEWDVSKPDVLTGKWPTVPMELVVHGASPSAYWHARGRLPDITIGVRGSGSGPQNGLAMVDGSGNVTYTSLGACWIPANAVPKVG